MSVNESTPQTPPIDGEVGHHAGGATDVQATSPNVTQEMLAALEELRLVAAEQKRLRQHILTLLDQGAAIEPGPLTARVVVQEHRRITNSDLRRLLGDARVEEMRSQVRARYHRYLYVRRVEPGDADHLVQADQPATTEQTGIIPIWATPRNPR